MSQDQTRLSRFYDGWHAYQRLLLDALAPLSPEQLGLSVAPSQRPVWLIAAHIIGTRVGWFQNTLGEGDLALAQYDAWDQDGAPPRTAGELGQGLDATWHMIEDCLSRWTASSLGDVFTTRRGRERTRQWVLWHVIEHDLHHGGELSLTLGAHRLAAPDL